MIKQEKIQEIMEAVRIEDVIGEYVNLRKRGVNLLGLCPFHNEKTPSFTVSPAKGIFKCFGCGKAGNAVGFLMEHEHFSYPEALKFLAKKYHIEIEEEEITEEEQHAQDERESLMAVTAYAQQYFSRMLHNTALGKSIGLSYFKHRGFRDDSIEKFQLGYAQDTWDAFSSKAIEEGYKIEYLEKTGLTIVKEGKRYDRFRGRILFPIHNLSGRIIGFGGRILSAEKDKPKYLNSPESIIYNKSKVLYGIYFARTEMVKKDNCYLVEGYTDVISLHQAGVTNVVASSGTSLTTDQIKLIKRYTPNITILYDGDEAGIKASFRGIDMILEEGMNVKIVLFPPGEDPDSFARNHRTSELEKFITEGAKDFILFKTDILRQEAGKDPIKKASLIRDIVKSVSLIPDGITRSVYVKECSVLLEVSEQILVAEINKIYRKRFSGKYDNFIPDPIIKPKSTLLKTEKAEVSKSEGQERDIIRILLQFAEEEIQIPENENNENTGLPVSKTDIQVIDIASYVVSHIQEDDFKFENPIYQAIYDLIFEKLEHGEFTTQEYLINYTNPAISQMVIDIMSTPYSLSENWRKNKIYVKREEDRLQSAVIHSVNAFKSRKIERKLAQHFKEMSEITDEEALQAKMEYIKALQDIQRKINSAMGRIIVG
ncbi:MAG TPA: DNA primase [Bacteroidales bacterium]|nr:DNA primase [Bacteroidales bacterium]